MGAGISHNAGATGKGETKMSESHKGEKNPFFGKRHTEEARQKIREAAKRRWARVRDDNGCRMLIAAIVRQAVKDGAAWFLESERGRSYCDIIGFKADKLQAGARRPGQTAPAIITSRRTRQRRENEHRHFN